MGTPRDLQRFPSQVYTLEKSPIKFFQVRGAHDMTGANKLRK